MMRHRATSMQTGRLAAAMLAAAACLGLGSAMGSFEAGSHRLGGMSRYCIAVPQLSHGSVAVQISVTAAGAAAALALLLWIGWRVRSFAGEAGLAATVARRQDAAMPVVRGAWVRSLRRGGLYGP